VGVEFRAFGRLEIITGDIVQVISQGREGNVLALLLAAHGQPLSADRLIDQLWSGDPPRRASTSLQVAISRLRRAIEPGRVRRAAAEHLISVAGGYALRVPDSAVDVWEFAADARRVAALSTRECAAMSESVLGSWRGAPYANSADTALVRSEVHALEEVRLALIEARAQALLLMGHPERVTLELPRVVQEHPFRERLWSLLALSQYQSLRQADALATLRALRLRLADELGVDPAPEVRRLEAAVLNQDADLSAPDFVELLTASLVATAA
jgi:DNA-binding SARP family transcriptional activator